MVKLLENMRSKIAKNVVGLVFINCFSSLDLIHILDGSLHLYGSYITSYQPNPFVVSL